MKFFNCIDLRTYSSIITLSNRIPVPNIKFNPEISLFVDLSIFYFVFSIFYRNQSGMISFPHFCEAMQCDATPQCETVFRLYDYEKTAHIDAREVRTYVLSSNDFFHFPFIMWIIFF